MEKIKKLEIIANWLYKIKRGLINDEILLFPIDMALNRFDLSRFLNKLSIKNEILELENISYSPEFNTIYLINNIDYSSIKEKINLEIVNIILFSSDSNVITSYVDYRKIFIFFNYDSNEPLKNIFSFFNKDTLKDYSDIKITEKDRLKIYLEKQNPILLLKSDYEVFKEYLLYKLFDSTQPIYKSFNHLIKETKYDKYLVNKNILKKLIFFELMLLKEKNILTSTLAMLIYKITTLDLKADKTKIGNYYRKQLGIKSKNQYYLNKLLEDSHSKDIEEFLKQAKVYDLNNSQIILSNEDILKIRIAKKLFLKNKLNLTSNEIQEITELSPSLMNLVLDKLGKETI